MASYRVLFPAPLFPAKEQTDSSAPIALERVNCFLLGNLGSGQLSMSLAHYFAAFFFSFAQRAF